MILFIPNSRKYKLLYIDNKLITVGTEKGKERQGEGVTKKHKFYRCIYMSKYQTAHF